MITTPKTTARAHAMLTLAAALSASLGSIGSTSRMPNPTPRTRVTDTHP